MQERISLAKIKDLLFSARLQINNMLSLKRTKKIKFEESQYFDLLSFLSLFTCCAENGSEVMNELDNVPCGDSLLEQIKKLMFEEVEIQFREIFKKQFYKMFPKAKKGKKYKMTIIFDLHEQETYAKDKKTNKNVRGGKHKNGTNYFFKYLTMQVMYKNKVMTFALKFYTREDKLSELLDELIVYVQEFVKIGLVLLDRGFRDVEIINNMEFRNAPILMPAVIDNKCKREFVKLVNRNFARVRYSLTNSRGNAADVTLIMIRLPNDKEIGFFTTMKFTFLKRPNFFLKTYAKRWNIETGYRLQNMFLPKTTSQNKVVRFFYFCYAVAMHNLWLIIRHITKLGKQFTVLKMKVILILVWVTTHLPYDW